MARKVALLIGVDDYGTGLKSLRCPTNGVAAMRSVLRNPDIGGFDQVVALMDPDVGDMRSRICEVFAHLQKEDMVLFYFTGHGIKDMSGDFYLTTSQTELFESGRPNAGTAVEAHFLKRELSNSWAERKVVILDCCFGAAFADGFLAMNNNIVDIASHFGGKGWCVMTSSTSSRYALEQEGESLSIYTRYLVEGLKTGGAALDGQDSISAQNLHEYVKTQIQVAAPAMEPAIFNGQEGHDIIIAKVQLNNEQRYRKQVQQRVRNGDIGPAGKAVLLEWRQRLGLGAMQASAIEAEILKPYKERQSHLALYAKALEAEKSFAYPFSEVTIQDLKELQRLLSLRDEDVRSVEAHVLQSAQLPVAQTVGTPDSQPPLIQPRSLQAPSSPTSSSHTSQSSFLPSQPQPDGFQPIHSATARSTRTRLPAAQAIAKTTAKLLARQPATASVIATQSVTAPPIESPIESSPAKSPSIKEWVRSTRVKPASFEPVTGSTFTFQTLRVDPQGEPIQKKRCKATYFGELIAKGVTLDMVRIPGGQFLMGETIEEREVEGTPAQCNVAVSEFWMSKYTITQVQWWAVMQREPRSPRSASPARENTRKNRTPLQPIENIFWTDAVEFCQRLSQQTGRTYQLPSGAQWEYACRAGTTSPFYFGETLTPELANYNGNYTYGEGPKGRYREDSTEVGCFWPNDFGLYDMHGNMWEWCLDGWHTPQGKYLDPRSASSQLANQKKSLRGGSWFYLPTNCRSAYSLTYPFHNRTDDISFRIICLHPNRQTPVL
ncbi:SUMF1/EgtB/PvdO family nonheme iron enzyme [cf. Phormidesmis sp. LEGE 11477]|uniref:caspase, EACC1-associated type n=1 Tax=cf. Phormidesmis sp. LEGE 11477 TaxID=1828680 RepID=UPI00187EE9DD|nr:SUMF1/EgtB/PvdO family nonheme iron enzyme [cf. Phormidesmis sp. LEGE 11477]MBE9062345.1 SUMF1/EgtB/PvdO family nonheme iron enzyme [cf. Phormidesmis sp. LEGE 11477]